MLRWKRFSEHSSIIEGLYVDLKNRLTYILSDYSDSIQRAKRLSIARETLLQNNTCANATAFIQKDDFLIYLRWMVSHIYSQKSFQQSMKVLEWLPHQMSIDCLSEYHDDDNNVLKNGKDTMKATKKSLETIYRCNNNSSEKNSSQKKNSLASYLNMKFKALDSVYLTSSNSLVPREEILNSISYSNYHFFFISFFTIKKQRFG